LLQGSFVKARFEKFVALLGAAVATAGCCGTSGGNPYSGPVSVVEDGSVSGRGVMTVALVTSQGAVAFVRSS